MRGPIRDQLRSLAAPVAALALVISPARAAETGRSDAACVAPVSVQDPNPAPRSFEGIVLANGLGDQLRISFGTGGTLRVAEQGLEFAQGPRHFSLAAGQIVRVRTSGHAAMRSGRWLRVDYRDGPRLRTATFRTGSPERGNAPVDDRLELAAASIQSLVDRAQAAN